MKADLILFNAHALTIDPSFPEAELIAVRGDKIWRITANDKIDELKDQRTAVIDCKHRTVLPGFNDAHGHLHALAESLVTLSLNPSRGVQSLCDIQAEIKKFSRNLSPGTWLRAGGYDEFHLAEKRHPTRWDLDAATSIHPIKLTHRSGRAHVLNSLALTLVGISRETSDPPRGLIDRDLKTGEPTGLLYGMSDFLSKFVPPLGKTQLEEGIKLANRELLSFGVTSIQDASFPNDMERWKMFQQWKERGLLKPRLTMMLGQEGFRRRQENASSSQAGENQLRLGGVKIIVDETTGRLSPPQQELNEIVLSIHQSGFQAVFHAIEQTPIEAACLAIEYAMQRFPRSDCRHRIDHCAVCPPTLSKRLASLEITVVTQPSFLYYHGDRYLRTVPDYSLQHLYPIKTLMQKGIKVSGSSDCPVVPANPLAGIYSAVSRKAKTGELVLPQERITPQEAILMYTEHAARATFEEKIKGSITPGKLADLVILNGDPTKLPVEEIKDIEVEMTILGGKVVWDKKGESTDHSLLNIRG